MATKNELMLDAAMLYNTIRIIRKRHPEMKLVEVEVVLAEINKEIK